MDIGLPSQEVTQEGKNNGQLEKRGVRKGLYADGKYKVPWKPIGRAVNTDLRLWEGGSVKESFWRKQCLDRNPREKEESEEKGTFFQVRGKAYANAQRQDRAGSKKTNKTQGHHFLSLCELSCV